MVALFTFLWFFDMISYLLLAPNFPFFFLVPLLFLLLLLFVFWLNICHSQIPVYPLSFIYRMCCDCCGCCVADFINLNIIMTWTGELLFLRSCSVLRRVFSSIPGLHISIYDQPLVIIQGSSLSIALPFSKMPHSLELHNRVSGLVPLQRNMYSRLFCVFCGLMDPIHFYFSTFHNLHSNS